MSSRLHVREAIAAAADTLAAAGIDSARTDAELLAAHAAGTDRGRLALLDPVEPDFFDRFGDAVAIRATRVPLQHIIGTVAFGPVQLQVGPGVFIPRPETEAMLEWALAQDLPPSPVIVDLCTGSGALAVALATGIRGATVIAVDDDASALDYARRNAASTPAVRVVAADATEPDLLPELVGSVDLVVANPPYIPCGAVLDPEVAEHDPHHALFGGSDGMAVIRPIVRRAADWLKPGGLLAVEHDDTTSQECVEVFLEVPIPGSLRSCPPAPIPGSLRSCPPAPAFTEVTARRDLTGRPRFVTARRGAQ
ncbi:MAG: peptide chain release factor N(5)-glutamine methyltransferase [Mycobacterium sp.]|nr:peptide chain release factor N(5)-glutamine methyltransferase [Mycobacterium sp.]